MAEPRQPRQYVSELVRSEGLVKSRAVEYALCKGASSLPSCWRKERSSTRALVRLGLPKLCTTAIRCGRIRSQLVGGGLKVCAPPCVTVTGSAPEQLASAAPLSRLVVKARLGRLASVTAVGRLLPGAGACRVKAASSALIGLSAAGVPDATFCCFPVQPVESKQAVHCPVPWFCINGR